METVTTTLFDLEMLLLILFICIVTAIGVYFLSIFGVKEKSYEEAIAEQKKRSEELLGKPPQKKVKVNKERVVRSQGKRVKSGKKVVVKEVEVQEEEVEKLEEVSLVEEVEVEEEKSVNGKKHIEIVEEPEVLEEVPQEHLRRPSLSTATPKKSILSKSDPSPQNPQTTEEEPKLNHFETLHPKDDVELKLEKLPKKLLKKATTHEKTNPTTLLHQITTSPLTPAELQSLIEALLNKQTPNWTPTSPTSKDSLKKQLQAKDGQISELESNLSSLTQKLGQIRLESSAEKSKLLQMKKQLEEILNSKQLEIQSLQQRFRQVSEVSLSKESDLQKSLLIYKQRCVEIGEEGERIKGEVGRREGEWRGKVESLEREVGALKAQYGKQGNQLSSAFQSNEDLTSQLRTLTLKLTTLEAQTHSMDLIIQEKDLKLCEISKKQDTENDKEHARLVLNLATMEKNLEELQRKFDDGVKNEVNLKKIVDNLKEDLVKGKLREEELRVDEGRRVGVLGEELGGVIKKNEELREKNGKLLESLKVSEKQLEDKVGVILEERRQWVQMVSSVVGVDVESPTFKTDFAEKYINKKPVVEVVEKVEDPKLTEITQKLGEEEEKSRKLGDEVEHYQRVLASTEHLLASLQSSIETEETKWLAKLAEKDAKLEQVLAKVNLNGVNGDPPHPTTTTTTPPTPTTHETSTESLDTTPPISTETTSSPSPSSKSSDNSLIEKKKKKKVLGFFSK